MVCKKNGIRFILSVFIVGLVFLSCSSQKSTQKMEEFKVDYPNESTTPASVPENLSKAESFEYFAPEYTRNENYIYKKNIKTVQLNKLGEPMSVPIIKLNSNEKLKLSFDDLDGDVKYYAYTVTHCNANWQASDLSKNEYILGFTDESINDYGFSFNTIQPFTHYRLIFPSKDLSLMVSGNYILTVFINDESDIAFTLRFMVVDPKVSVTGRIKRSSIIADRNYRQEVDFVINSRGYSISEPYMNLNVVIMQNFRWDNAIVNLKPKMVIGDELDYNYDYENIFDGGNNFRNVDMKSLRYQSPRIKSIKYENDKNHVYIWDDIPRPYKVYKSDEDINGKCLINCDDARDVGIECDYAYVHFFVPFPNPIADGNLYIMGNLANWQFARENQMVFNSQRMGYEGTLYLKEGYYNWLYAFLPNNTTTGDITLIEGNHYETENDYYILIYYREQGSLHDELIGMQLLNSFRDS